MIHFTGMLRVYKAISLIISAGTLAFCQQAELGPAPAAPSFENQSIPQGESAGPVPLAAASGSWIDTSNREAVRSSYLNVYLPTSGVPMGWTGSVPANDPGTTASAYRDAVFARINWFRSMAGVPAIISFDPTYNAKDQQAALMFSANRQISHTPPSSWVDWSSGGAEAASNSNICLYYGQNWTDSGCIALYILDSGTNNAEVGHRRWLLYPQTQIMGTGDVPVNGSYYGANAVWVFDGRYGSPRPATRDNFVAWPPPGYVPYQLVYPRWSFSYPGADFSNATVTMTRSGSPVAVRLETLANGYGENTLVWVPDNQDPNSSFTPVAPGSDTPTNVSISNVLIGGTPQTFTYTVTVFDPSQSGTTSAGWVNIVSKNSGKCLDVTGISTAPGASLQQWTCWGGDNQKFQLIPVTGGYQIAIKNSGLSVDVWGGYPNNASNGLPLKQWTYWGGSNQIFQLQTTADGYYTIHPTNSGQCVDVAGGQTNDGATVWQWSCWGGNNQKWSFIPVQ